MLRTRSLSTALRVAAYLGIAVLLFGTLLVMASRGAWFQPGHGTYEVTLPGAPGLRASKSSVFNPAGVEIGVVTGIDNDVDHVNITIKLKREFPVFDDAQAEVRTISIFGDTALFLEPGGSGRRAPSGASIPAADNPHPAELHEAFDVFETAVNQGDRALSQVQTLQDGLRPALSDLEAVADDVSELAAGIDNGAEPLVDSGRRLKELVHTLATHSGDTTALIGEVAAVTRDLAGLVDRNLQDVTQILVGTSRLSAAVTEHMAQINAAYAALPDIVDRLQLLLDQLNRVFDREPNAVIQARVSNLPSIQHWLDILKGGRK